MSLTIKLWNKFFRKNFYFSIYKYTSTLPKILVNMIWNSVWALQMLLLQFEKTFI